MVQPAVAAARMSRETATLGVPPRHATLAGTRWAAAATRVLTPSTTQMVPLGGGGAMRGTSLPEIIPRVSRVGSLASR